jgi:hypothetical protein
MQMPRTNKLSAPRQLGLQMDSSNVRAKATTNSSPADFAAAWTQVASAGAWKREGKKQRSLGLNRPPREHMKVSQRAVTEDLDSKFSGADAFDVEDTKDIPWPKWFAPAEQSCVSNHCLVIPCSKTDHIALAAAVDRNDEPLKICLPGNDSYGTHLNPAMPVKKRVPDWEF